MEVFAVVVDAVVVDAVVVAVAVVSKGKGVEERNWAAAAVVDGRMRRRHFDRKETLLGRPASRKEG